MKWMKKLATLILSVCLLVPCFSIFTHAADGEILFSDPKTQAGVNVTVKGVVQKSSGNFGEIEINMTYDTAMLKFEKGDNITETSSGNLKYAYDAKSVNGNRVEFYMEFLALKQGVGELKVASSTVKNRAGSVLNYTQGFSQITIQGGQEVTLPTTPEVSSDAIVEINGKIYRFADAVPENEIPEGYEAATLEYDLVTYNVVHSAASGLSLAYLIGEDSVGSLFMYVEENATFAPYQAIKVSETVTIALLSDVSEIVLPAQYKKTEVILHDIEFPGWKDKTNPDFCIIYAVTDTGEKSLYQLDTAEGTYQRFIAPEVVVEELRNPLIAKLSELLQNHLDYVILGTGIGFLLFVIIIVVLSVKLYNRNAELDEIYEEYGLGDEDDEETEDDIYLDLDEEDDDDEGEDSREMESFVQAGLRELFPEEPSAPKTEEVIPQKVEAEPKVVETEAKAVPAEPKAVEVQPKAVEVETTTVEAEPMKVEKVVKEEPEMSTLGQVLQQQKEAKARETFDDDDDTFDNFSIDFIDLDD